MAATLTVQDLLGVGTGGPELVEVAPTSFIMVDGRGDPNGPEFQDALHAIYALSYGAKFALKRGGVEFKVMPLEALWGSSPGDVLAPRAEWTWTAMIAQPWEVTDEVFGAQRQKALSKSPTAALRRARLEVFNESLAAQVMHIGPYSAELPTIEDLHPFITAQGYMPCGRHHEIYLGDPRRAAPEKLRTILRQPVA